MPETDSWSPGPLQDQRRTVETILEKKKSVSIRGKYVFSSRNLIPEGFLAFFLVLRNKWCTLIYIFISNSIYRYLTVYNLV